MWGREEGGRCRRCWRGEGSCTSLVQQARLRVHNVPRHQLHRSRDPDPASSHLHQVRIYPHVLRRVKPLSFQDKWERGAGRERGRTKRKGKKKPWQVFRAQSRSGNTSLPLIASRPDEFLEETATEMLHKSHCCACVGCLLKEVKGHRLWCIKKKKIMIF